MSTTQLGPPHVPTSNVKELVSNLSLPKNKMGQYQHDDIMMFIRWAVIGKSWTLKLELAQALFPKS